LCGEQEHCDEELRGEQEHCGEYCGDHGLGPL
jgi:hypothetical protein